MEEMGEMTGYFNAVTTDLIQKLDFIPLRDSNGNFMFSQGYVALGRRDICSYRIVELIDGDRLSAGQIKNHLVKSAELNRQFSRENTCETPEMVQVFIFSDILPWDKLQVLENQDYGTLPEDKIPVSISIELSSRSISFHSNSYFNMDGISFILKDRLEDRLDGYEQMPNLDELVYKQEEEPVIEEVSSKNPATYVFIGINIAIWVVGWLLELVFDYNYITNFGVKYSPYIVRGEYWRLVTPMFLHADLMHLAANSFSLLILGQVVERIFGTGKFLFIYIQYLRKVTKM